MKGRGGRKAVRENVEEDEVEVRGKLERRKRGKGADRDEKEEVGEGDVKSRVEKKKRGAKGKEATCGEEVETEESHLAEKKAKVVTEAVAGARPSSRVR